MTSLKQNLIVAIEDEYVQRLSLTGSGYELTQEIQSHPPTFGEVAQFLSHHHATALQVIVSPHHISHITEVRNVSELSTIIAGGGITSIEMATEYLKAGADYIIVGSHFVQNFSEVEKFIEIFGSTLIISVDDNNGTIARTKDLNTLDYCRKIAALNPPQVSLVNEATRLTGQIISLERLAQIRALLPHATLIYSGGIHSRTDIKNVIQTGADAILIGTLAYTTPTLLEENLYAQTDTTP